jgi:hypothetical protein
MRGAVAIFSRNPDAANARDLRMTFDREQQQAKPPLRTELDPQSKEPEPESDNPWKDLGPNPYPGVPTTRPDEVPIDWRGLVSGKPPSDPFSKLDCVVKDRAPDDPAPVKPTFRKRPHGEHHGKDPGCTIERVGDAHAVARYGYWEAFRAAGLGLQQTHDAVGVEVGLFSHAERDKDLRAMLFMLPNGKWTGELDDLAELQQVPTRGGPTVGGLFDDKNKLALSKHDRGAIDQLGHATQTGRHGRTEKAAGSSIAADNDFSAAVFSLQANVESAEASKKELKAAIAALEALEAEGVSVEAMAAVERYKQEVAEILEIVEISFAAVTAIAQFGTKNVGDGIEQIGIIAGKLLSHVNDAKIAAAQRRADIALAQMRKLRGEAASATVAAAQSALEAALLRVPAGNALLRKSMTLRRQAYNELGVAAGSELDCPQTSRAKIAGMLAAIPIAEMVAARAGVIRERSARAPGYDHDAGRGFAMSRHAMTRYPKMIETIEFVRGLDELVYCERYYGHLEKVWTQRVVQLHEVRRKIIGARPAD